MEVLIIGQDSDIGGALVKLHLALGDVVHTTSRRGTEGAIPLDICDRRNWPMPPKVDRIYFLIGTTDTGVEKADVMLTNAVMPVDYLGKFASHMRPGTEVIVFSSQFGSIGRAVNARAYTYRMSKAALNMGVRCLAHAHPRIKWCVYHPGIVKTKMIGEAWRTFNFEVLEIEEAAEKCVANINKWKGEFAFLSYDGTRLEW